METLITALATTLTIANDTLKFVEVNAPNDISEQRWSLSLLQTKMTPPRPPRGRVGRQALLARLSSEIERTLTVVIAPAGFGKTTLLAEWCEVLRAKQHLVAWLSLDAEDDDPQQFGAYVLASLSRAPNGVGRHAEALLRNDPLTPGKTVISVLLNEIATCGWQVFLVLDDFDRLTSEPIRATVSRLLRYAPENFHVLLGTRSEPSLALGQFRTQEQLLRLDAADLRFSADDAHAFFAQAAGVALDRPSVELLNDATEGWVAGLQLAALALRQTGDASRVARDLASSRFGIDAYLDETVLTQLPPPMLQFLLRTSILERLGAGVCDAVMGAGALSWETLDWLEHHNVFIRALDAERHWFRTHVLLSDALRRRAAQQLSAELPTLHRRASQWFAAEHLWPEAVRHALAGGELQQAATWAENCAMALLDRSDVRTLLGWIAKLPHELVSERSRLRLAKAWALALSLRTDEATQVVPALASDVARTRDDSSRAEGDHDAALQAEVSAVSALIAGLDDDSPRSLELGRKAAASPLPAPPWVRRFAETAQVFGLLYDGQFDEVRRMRSVATVAPGNGQSPIYAEVYRASMFGLSSLVEGRLPEAVQIFESALAHAEGAVGRNSAAAALPAGYLAALHYEGNDLTRAQQMVNDRTTIAVGACPLGSLLHYCRAAACLHARRGDLGAALVILGEAREIAASRRWMRLRAGCDAEAVRLCLRQGWLDQSQQTADALQAAMPGQLPAPMGSFLETWASYCSVRARLDIASDRPDQAAALLDDLRGKLAAAGMKYLEAGTSLLLALALEQGGAQQAALASLARALRYAQTNGMINSFVNEGEPVRALLLGWRHDGVELTGIDAAFLDRLLAAFEDNAAPVAAAGAGAARNMSDVLTAREIEILDHTSRGLSNKEIGRALQVAPETIKWHLKNIFEKLHVSSRVEAVQSGLAFPRTARIGASDAGPRVH